MVKFFLKKETSSSESIKADTDRAEKLDPHKYLFFVYVKWSRENRVIKTYMKSKNLKNEREMIYNGLSDLVSRPDMKLNRRNIKMAILFQLDDDHDVTKNYDVTGKTPTRLDHYLNSDPSQRIQFSQEQIENIVNSTTFTHRELK